MAIFTVPLKGTTVTIKAGAANDHGKVMKRSTTMEVRSVSVYPGCMVVVGWVRGTYLYRRITDPNMIDWK